MPPLALPYSWQELEPEETARIQQNFPVSSISDLVRYDNGLLMPRAYITIAEKLYNFPLRDDDIWIVTFPKTGTTWTVEMAWMLVNDVDKVKGEKPQLLRSPFLEVGSLMGEMPMPEGMAGDMVEMMTDTLAYAETLTERRVLKSHLPIEFLPPGITKRCKVIYVARNPKDTCVSYYFHNLSMPGHGYVGDFPQFAEDFASGLQLYGDFFSHVLSGWRVKDDPNVRFLWFEDMKKNQREIIKDMCIFLDHPLTSEQVDRLVEHLKFENMKLNMSTNPTAGFNLKSDFMRKGVVGDWKNFFTPEKTLEWEKMIKEKTAGTDLAENIPSS